MMRSSSIPSGPWTHCSCLLRSRNSGSRCSSGSSSSGMIWRLGGLTTSCGIDLSMTCPSFSAVSSSCSNSKISTLSNCSSTPCTLVGVLAGLLRTHFCGGSLRSLMGYGHAPLVDLQQSLASPRDACVLQQEYRLLPARRK